METYGVIFFIRFVGNSLTRSSLLQFKGLMQTKTRQLRAHVVKADIKLRVIVDFHSGWQTTDVNVLFYLNS